MFKKAAKTLFLYGFKIQAATAAKDVLIHHYKTEEVQGILDGYWQKYLEQKPEVPNQPTLGGTLMVHLAAMSRAFYMELISRGQMKEASTQLFYEIALKVYIKMGKLSWWLAGRGNRYNHLLKATRLFRKFPFNAPSYGWQDVDGPTSTVSFNCVKCPVAEYFQSKGLSEFCVETWCALDYPLAEMWDASLERTGSIAGGAEKCDFHWKLKTDNNKSL